MNEKNIRNIVGIGLIAVICLCGFLVLHENKGSAAESADSVVSDADGSGVGLLKMFEEGLQQKSKGIKPEYYYGMVEAAIQQSSQYPELISKFWGIFEMRLNDIPASQITPVARIELINLFEQQADLCVNHCKNIEQYNKYWETTEKITAYKTDVINKEISNSLSLLESAEKENPDKIIRVLKKEIDKTDENSFKLLVAYNFLSDYSSELTDEQQEKLGIIVQKAGTSILSEVRGKLDDIEKRFKTIKNGCHKARIEPVVKNTEVSAINDSEDSAVKQLEPYHIEYGIGESYQLLLDIQTFIANDMNMEMLQTIPDIETDQILQLQKKASELLEKTRILNQIRYNLWAYRIIYNADDIIQFKRMSMISVEFLYPVVLASYNDKMDKIIKKHPEANNISANVFEMILKDKAPLSAF